MATSGPHSSQEPQVSGRSGLGGYSRTWAGTHVSLSRTLPFSAFWMNSPTAAAQGLAEPPQVERGGHPARSQDAGRGLADRVQHRPTPQCPRLPDPDTTPRPGPPTTPHSHTDGPTTEVRSGRPRRRRDRQGASTLPPLSSSPHAGPRAQPAGPQLHPAVRQPWDAIQVTARPGPSKSTGRSRPAAAPRSGAGAVARSLPSTPLLRPGCGGRSPAILVR
jgi:hypothetical protein